MEIQFPDNSTEIIDQIREEIGRPATFFIKESVDCPNCILDPVTNTSTNSFCPVCSGIGYLVAYSGVVISGHITHAPGEIQQWSSGGYVFDGDAKLQIKYTLTNREIVARTSYVLIDEQAYTIKKKTLRGVREINRIILDLLERNP
jgi:hypothetical protein